MLYKDKNNWNTYEGHDAKIIAALLNVPEAKILRIGNDTSDEKEMTHMDLLYAEAHTRLVEDSDNIFICVYNGEMFLRCEDKDVVSYFIVNVGEPMEISDKDSIASAIWGFAHSSDLNNFKNSLEENFIIKRKNEVLTVEALEAMEPGTVFAEGVIENSPAGLYMSNENIGKKLLWVAKRGMGIPDWAIYTHWEERGREFVLQQGDKVMRDNAKKLVRCTDAALNMYRR